MDPQGCFHVHRQGKDVTFVTYGRMVNQVLRAAEKLETAGVSAQVIRLLTLDVFPIEKLLPHISGPVIVVEEACTGSGIREAFAWELRAALPDQRVYGMDLGPDFVTHGAQDKLYKHCGLDEEAIVKLTGEVLKG